MITRVSAVNTNTMPVRPGLAKTERHASTRDPDSLAYVLQDIQVIIPSTLFDFFKRINY